MITRTTVAEAASLLSTNLSITEAVLEYMIMATPSGADRNLLTEINIHMMAARAAFDKYMVLT